MKEEPILLIRPSLLARLSYRPPPSRGVRTFGRSGFARRARNRYYACVLAGRARRGIYTAHSKVRCTEWTHRCGLQSLNSCPGKAAGLLYSGYPTAAPVSLSPGQVRWREEQPVIGIIIFCIRLLRLGAVSSSLRSKTALCCCARGAYCNQGHDHPATAQNKGICLVLCRPNQVVLVYALLYCCAHIHCGVVLFEDP